MASTPDTSQHLDVRTIDGEPFGAIVSALDELSRDEQLVLIAGFEPVPLYDVLDSRGFAYETTQRDDEEYQVLIEHD